MTNPIRLLIIIFCASLSFTLHAQNEDSKYLIGAVPELNGKVIFTKEFSIPGMEQNEIYECLLQWLNERLKQNNNNSRIVYSNKEKGQIVGTGDEWIVFSSSALSLDRTRILYQPAITCLPAKCIIEISKIRFIYREGEEKYTAEEWIVDQYALNKSKTKLVRGLAKWRRKTVDFIDELFLEAAEALSTTTTPNKQNGAKISRNTLKEQDKVIKSFANSGPTVITPKKEIITKDINPQQIVIQEQEINNNTSTESIEDVPLTSLPTATDNQPLQYKEIAPEQLKTDAIQANTGKLVIVIGDGPFNMTTMTANSGGTLGKINGKAVVFCILSPEQPYEQLEKAESYIVRFYPNGANEPSLILECKKHPAPTAEKNMPRTYVGEITKAICK